MKLKDISLDKDKMYILCTMGQGDTFIVVNLKDKLEAKYKAEIIFVLPADYTYVANLTGEEQCIIVDETEEDIREETHKLVKECPKPTKGKIYIVNFQLYEDFIDAYPRLRFRFNDFFKLPKEDYLKYKIKPLIINEELKNKITDIAPLDKIVMLCPESNYAPKLKQGFVEKLVKKLQLKGYTVISGGYSYSRSVIKGAVSIDMSDEEALQLAYNCHSVYALRSSFSELCVGLRKRLHVFYPEESLYNECSFANNYDIHDIEEIIVRKNKKLRDIRINKNKIYILCSMNQGETFTTVNLKDKLEAKYKSKIVFILLDEQKFIAKLTGEKQYIVIDKYEDLEKDLQEISHKNLKPEKGKIYVADFWLYEDFDDYFCTSISRYNDFFQLPKEEFFTYKIIPPKINKRLKNKITKIAPLDKVIMLCPDANSAPAIKDYFWEELAEQKKAEGFTIVSSVINAENAVKGTVYVDMNVEEALQLAYNCHSVYALRSGFSDMCVGLRERLHVFYPNEIWYNEWNFVSNYNISDIEEKVIKSQLMSLRLDKEKMYFLCTMDRGNTFTLINLKDRLEAKYKSKIVFVLPKDNEIIAKLIGEEQYIAFDRYDGLEKEVYEINSKCPKPAKGKIFVADFLVHDDFDDSFHPMCSRYNHFYGLSENEYFTYKIKRPKINEELKNKITQIAPLDKVIMFCADANSVQPLREGFWEELAEQKKAEGFTIISSVMKAENAVKGTVYVDMNIEEALQLAYNCHSVYALRSGFCDMCIGLREKLHVFYPDEAWYDECGFANNYGIHDIEEKIISNQIKDILLDKNKIYIFCSVDQGDIFIMMNLKERLEAKYKAEIVFIMFSHHGFIAKVMNEKQYIKFYHYNNIEEDMKKLSQENPKPTKGKILVVDYNIQREIFEKFDTLRSQYNTFFDLPKDEYLTCKIKTLKAEEYFKDVIACIAPFEKIIMLCPEESAERTFKPEFWENLAKTLRAEDYTVVSFVNDYKETIPGTQYVRMGCYEALQLAYNCHSVYTPRSSFSELCVGLKERLHVFYSDEASYNKLSFAKNYNIHDIDERIITE